MPGARVRVVCRVGESLFDDGSDVHEWNFTVRAYNEANKEVVLRWANIDDIPETVQFTLINSDGDEFDLRSLDAYRFMTSGELESSYGFTLRSRGNLSSVAGASGLPQVYQLFAPYPNPFNPTTTITVALPEAAEVGVHVYNLLGERVTTLANRVYPAGYQRFVLNGNSLSSGVYFVRVKVPDRLSDTRRIVLVK